MNLSLILNVNNFSEKFKNTLDSILKHKSDEYAFELIIVNDSGHQLQSQLIKYLTELFFSAPFPLKILNNLRGQGFSYNMNNAMANAQGKYLIFLEEGQEIRPTAINDFCSSMEKYEKSKQKVDIVEFSIFYENSNFYSSRRLLPNKLYQIKNNPEIFAKVNSYLFTKAFNREFIKKHNILFLNYVRYDTFFIYKFLSEAQTFLSLDLVFCNSNMESIKYSVYDLLKQWVHIFNYYRSKQLYARLQSELDYAFIRYCLANFLELVQLQENRILAIKSIISVENKISRRLKKFNNNPYRLMNHENDPNFQKILADIPEFINNWKDTYCK